MSPHRCARGRFEQGDGPADGPRARTSVPGGSPHKMRAMATDGQRIRVVLADDSYLVREALEHVLAEADDVEVVGSCGDRDSLLEAVDTARPDVIVTDIRMPPGGDGAGGAGGSARTAPPRGCRRLRPDHDPVPLAR